MIEHLVSPAQFDWYILHAPGAVYGFCKNCERPGHTFPCFGTDHQEAYANYQDNRRQAERRKREADQAAEGER